ncbi:MAG: hypothetical protein MAG431_01149 [Chloroflexi bacterium]|nr:hypothetical protein [Chloroflexota bacterium]
MNFGSHHTCSLKNNYGLLGSHRVLSLLADDVGNLVEEFYPQPEHLSSGWMVYTATLATETRVYPGFRAGEHELVTIAWPVLTAEDIEKMASLPTGKAGLQAKRKLQKKRVLRLVEYGLGHEKGPLLLTLSDLSLMIGVADSTISRYLQELRDETGKALPTKGYHFDQGVRPTHKTEIINLYEVGVDESVIALRTEHGQASVGRYIRDYERVKLLLANGTPQAQIATVISRRESIVKEYVKLLQKHHPELFAEKPL